MKTTAKTAVITTVISLLIGFNAEIRPILMALSDQRTPHAHWYTLKIGNTTYECTPANTSEVCDAIAQYETAMPTIILYTRAENQPLLAQHRLLICHNTTPLTVLGITSNTITSISHLNPQNHHTTPINGDTAIILPRHPKAKLGTTVTLQRHHVDEWDY